MSGSLLLLLQGVVSGLLIGAIYALVALGLNIIFGTTRVINFAQGALLMAAMYIAYGLWAYCGLNPYLSPLVSVPVLFALGYWVQAWLVAPVLARESAREPMGVLLMTLGLTMVLENSALLLFHADLRSVTIPISRARWRFHGLILSEPRVIGFVVMIVVAVTLYLFFTRTDMGRAIRAVGQDRQVARLLGINDRYVFNIAFGIGAGLMGIAAAVLIPVYYTSPDIGTSFVLKAFIIVVLGGLGSMPGAVLGALVVGVIEGVVGLYTQAAVAQVVLFAMFVAMLLVRPTGLLGVERR